MTATAAPPGSGPDDPFADGDEETMRDVRTCEILHLARADFHGALVEGSAISWSRTTAPGTRPSTSPTSRASSSR